MSSKYRCQPQCWLVAGVESFVTCCTWMNRPIWIIGPFPVDMWASLAKFKWRAASLPHDEISFQSRWRDTSIRRPAYKSLLVRLGDLRLKRTKWTTREFHICRYVFSLWRHVKLGPVSLCLCEATQDALLEGVDVERDVHKWDRNNVIVRERLGAGNIGLRAYAMFRQHRIEYRYLIEIENMISKPHYRWFYILCWLFVYYFTSLRSSSPFYLLLLLLLLMPKFEGDCINASSGRKSQSVQFETYTDKIVLQWRWNFLTSNVGPRYNADVQMRISHVRMFTHMILLTLSITLNLNVINPYLPMLFVDSPHFACMIASATHWHFDWGHSDMVSNFDL